MDRFRWKPKSRRSCLRGVAGRAERPRRRSYPPTDASPVFGRQMALIVLHIRTLKDASHGTQDRSIRRDTSIRLGDGREIGLNHFRYGDPLLFGVPLRTGDNRIIHTECELRHLYVLYQRSDTYHWTAPQITTHVHVLSRPTQALPTEPLSVPYYSHSGAQPPIPDIIPMAANHPPNRSHRKGPSWPLMNSSAPSKRKSMNSLPRWASSRTRRPYAICSSSTATISTNAS